MSIRATVAKQQGVDSPCCPACCGRVHRTVERVTAEEIAAGWAADRPGAADLIRTAVRRGEMPDSFSTLECDRCGAGFFVPGFAGGPDWYAEVEQYPDRWEYRESVVDLGVSPKRVLEVGCGTGVFLSRLRTAGHRGTGLDFNAGAVASARGRGLDARVGDLASAAREIAGRFDAVACYHVLEHIEDLDGFFAELRDVASLGSTLCLSVPGPRRFTSELVPHQRVGMREMWDYPPHHQTRWSRRSLTALLERQGWRPDRFAEEPFDWRGVATYLTSLEFGDLAAMPPGRRRVRIGIRALRLLPARFRWAGMSLYCRATRVQ
jgi:SAM-dependent methyltransferase